MIRNFCIIAHIDHGKSTLADRFLELTGTVEKRKMQEQYLDTMELERERGITIKLQPVRMIYHANHGLTQPNTQTDTDVEGGLLYEGLTYKIRGAVFNVKKVLGLGHKETVYHKALVEEFKKLGLSFESEKILDVFYENKKVGTYVPDFIIEDKVLVELKSLPEIGRPQEQQLWSYLKGCQYHLALLVNFGSTDVSFRRIIKDSSDGQRQSASSPRKSAQVEDYILNLIDTPGHVDFSYEVSRSLAAVEGAILLVDATKGIQAQTLANLHLAQQQGLTIIPAINKIDLPNARPDEIEEEIQYLLDDPDVKIHKISAKTGQGVKELLEDVIRWIPPPRENGDARSPRALIFDSAFDTYKGIIAFVRVFDGSFRHGDKIMTAATKAKAEVLEVGYFSPALVQGPALENGQIGYIATGLKDPGQIKVGDTITTADISGLDTDQRGKSQHKSAGGGAQGPGAGRGGRREGEG